MSMSDDSLDTLHRRLIASALALADALDAAIDGAPLNQLSAALGLIIDRLLKLEALAPHSSASLEEEVIRIEYLDPDGGTAKSSNYSGAFMTFGRRRALRGACA